ncbi:hypothetical protein QBC42DRAFT_292371, partial [Cladorrhinum samala]
MDSQYQQYTRPKTFRKLSNASSIITDIFRPETAEDIIQRKIKQANDRDTARDLINFLRNTSPPPHNYMSFPDKFASSPSAKKPKSKKKHMHHLFCLSFWKKSKSAKAKNQQKQSSTAGLIKLPDSAVAGRTIGGHRHIAISIPVEYAHLDLPPAATMITNTTILKPGEEKPVEPRSPQTRARDQEKTAARSRLHERVANTSVGAHTCSLPSTSSSPHPHELTPLQEDRESKSSRVLVAGSSPVRNNPINEGVVPAPPQLKGHPLLVRQRTSVGSFHTTASSDSIQSEAVTIRSLSPPLHLPLIALGDASPTKSTTTIDRKSLLDAAEQTSCGSLSEPPNHQATLVSLGTSSSGDYETPIESRLSPLFPPLSPPAFRPPCRMTNLKITPVVTVANIPPTSPSSRHRASNAILKKTSFGVVPQIQITASSPQKSNLHHMSSLTNMRSTTSIERIVLSQHTTTTATAPSPGNTSQNNPELSRRSASHQSLLRRYEQLQSSGNREIDILAARLDQSESANQRWMNAMVPLFEMLTERLCPSSISSPLSRSYTSLRQESGTPATPTPPPSSPTSARPKSRRGNHPHQQSSLWLSQPASHESLDWAGINIRRGGRRVLRGAGSSRDRYGHQGQEEEEEAQAAQETLFRDIVFRDPRLGFGGLLGGGEVAVDRCPTRSGKRETLMGDDEGEFAR